MSGDKAGHGIVADCGRPRGRGIKGRADDDSIEPGGLYRIALEEHAGARREAHRVVESIVHGIAGDHHVGDGPHALPVATVAHVKGGLLLHVGIAAASLDHVARHGAGRQIGAVRPELANAEADVACRVAHVVALDQMATPAVDGHSLATPWGYRGVVHYLDVRHRRVLLAAVVVDRIDGDGVISRPSDEVVLGGEIVSYGPGEAHVVEVAPIRPYGREPAILHRSPGTGRPETGFRVLRPDAVGQPVGARGVHRATR